MNIELRPLAEIKPYEKNPRVNDMAVEAVARSVGEFGFRQPIVVDADGVIVVGRRDGKLRRGPCRAERAVLGVCLGSFVGREPRFR